MTASEWQSSADPQVMIRWLEGRGCVEPLWEFAIACCRAHWEELPGEPFRRVVEHFERIGAHDINDVLSDAYQALEKLVRRLNKTSLTEQQLLSRQIAFGRMVLAFEHQDAASAARSISEDLVEWAEDANQEQQTQANLLRLLAAESLQ